MLNARLAAWMNETLQTMLNGTKSTSLRRRGRKAGRTGETEGAFRFVSKHAKD